MLTMICSAVRQDNIDAIYNCVGHGIAAGKKQLILVPETHSHRAEKHLLDRWGNRAGLYAQVMTFTKLADRALKEAGRELMPIDKGGRVLLMYKAIRSVESSLEYYKNAAERPDMLSSLISVASEFRSCLIEPEQLMAQRESMNAKLRDISLIYAAYCAQCEGRAAHGSDKLESAVPYIAEHSAVAGAEVLIYGFQGFTAAEYRIMEKLIEGGAGLTVTLDLGEDPQLFAEQIKTKGRLERLASTAGYRWMVKQPPHINQKEDPALGILAKSLFDFSIPAFEKDSQAIKLYSCKDVVEECELAAGICRSLVLEGKARLRDIAIVSAEADQYEKYLQQSFQRCGLPLYVSRKEDFLDKPAAAAALGAFRAIEDHFSFQSVLRYMKSGLVGLTRDEQEKLENYAYTWQIRGNNWFRDWTLSPEGYDGREAPEELMELNAVRRKLTDPLVRLRDTLPPSASAAVYANAIRAHLERIELEAQIEARANLLTEQKRAQEGAEYRQIYDIFCGAIDQFEAVFGEDALSRSDLLSLLELMLRQYTIGTIPVSLDMIELSDFQRAAFGTVPYLFILGAREGAMPPVVTGGSLLKERDRILLETCGIELTQSDEERTYEYMSDIYQVIDSAVKQIIFTCPKRGFGGNHTAKSYLLDRAEAVFPQSAMEEAGPVVRRNRLLSSTPAFEVLCSGDLSAEQVAAEQWFEHREEGQYYNALQNYADQPRHAIAHPERIEGLYGDTLYMSATRAEKFYSCPFSFFMQYGLKAKERRKAAFEATNVGTLVHYVVENAVRTLSFDPTLDPDAVVEDYVTRFLKDRLGGSEEKSARFMVNYDRIKINIKAIVRDIMEEIAASSFVPVAFEMTFGGKEGYAPYTVRSGSTRLELHGSIDRVDGYIKDDVLYVRVSDYKTGSKSFTLSDILSGLNMQMFIYMLMLRSVTPAELEDLTMARLGQESHQAAPCAALYIPAKSPYIDAPLASSAEEIEENRQKKVKRIGIVRSDDDLIDALEHSEDGKYRFLPIGRTKSGGFTATSKVVDADELGDLIHETEQNLARMARRISGGDIAASPYVKGNVRYCDWCPYRAACQFDTGMRSDRYRFIKSYKKDAVMARIRGEEDEHGC